jgi:hypothetical protein
MSHIFLNKIRDILDCNIEENKGHAILRKIWDILDCNIEENMGHIRLPQYCSLICPLFSSILQSKMFLIFLNIAV